MFTVVLPWRPQPSRLAAFDRVVDWYRSEFPDARILPIDSDDEVFNLAVLPQPRDGLDRRSGCTAVILPDADTFPEPEALRAAIAEAAESGLVHLPYTEYHWLGPRQAQPSS